MRKGASGSFGSRGLMSNLVHVQKTLTPSEVTALHATPIEIVRAPGAGKVLLPVYFAAQVLSTGHTPYAAGSALDLGNSGNSAMLEIASNRITPAADAFSLVEAIDEQHGTIASFDNLALNVSTAGAEFTGGTGTDVILDVWYFILE